MAQRHFLVTIREETALDADGVQDAIVNRGDESLDFGNVDVELIEFTSAREKGPNSNDYKIIFSVVDAV